VVALRTMRQSMLSCAATYRHFLAALWLGVLALLTWV
jgi:heme/copper-type cytochrome/quinol oxidase subunit 3